MSKQYINTELNATPFPRKYIHSVFDTLQDAVQAKLALQAARYAARDIHLMTGREYMEALDRGQTFTEFLSGDDDTYLYEARRGRFIVAIRVYNHAQVEQVRDLLAPLHAHLIKYVDTWTVSELL